MTESAASHKLPISDMTVAQLKSELLSMNNPGFIHNNKAELESVLRSARRFEESKNKSIGSVEDESGATAATAEIGALDISEYSAMSSASERSDDRQTNEVLDDSTIETPDGEGNEAVMSRRLVEYFVMVSSVPVTKDGVAMKSKRRKSTPPDPTRDRMNSRTAGRFEVRRAHLTNVRVEKSVDTIEEDEEGGHNETASTTSTSSTVEETIVGGTSSHAAVDRLKPSNEGMAFIPQDDYHNAAAAAAAPGSKSKEDDTGDYLLEPVITARYPAKDHEDQPLNPRLPQFCHPEGTDLIQPTKEYKMPRIHYFVLTVG